jgi:hypothetical protein
MKKEECRMKKGRQAGEGDWGGWMNAAFRWWFQDAAAQV